MPRLQGKYEGNLVQGKKLQHGEQLSELCRLHHHGIKKL
jgi:hypothetical protein